MAACVMTICVTLPVAFITPHLRDAIAGLRISLAQNDIPVGGP